MLQHWLPRDINKVVVYIRRGSIEVFVSMYIIQCTWIIWMRRRLLRRYCFIVKVLSVCTFIQIEFKHCNTLRLDWLGLAWIGWTKIGSAWLGLAGPCYSCFNKWTMTQRLVSMYTCKPCMHGFVIFIPIARCKQGVRVHHISIGLS